MKVYSPQGEMVEREPVDCRELLAQGWSTDPGVKGQKHADPHDGNTELKASDVEQPRELYNPDAIQADGTKEGQKDIYAPPKKHAEDDAKPRVNVNPDAAHPKHETKHHK